MKHFLIIIIGLAITVPLFVLISCSKDHDITHDDIKLPSAQIIASEKLAIPDAVTIPANTPGGTIRVVTYYAEGVQRYKASPKAGNPSVFEWVFVEPDAKLYDITDQFVGTHGAGPYWQLSVGDSIYAQQFNPARTAPSSDTQSIDWLLLKAKDGTVPFGIFSDVDYIQRIATKGGKAPLTAPVSSSDTIRVKYTAVYRFTKIKG
jgi:hypothetical protein